MATTVSERVRVSKRLSDNTCYGTRIGSSPHIIAFRNEYFDELKDLLKSLTDVIHSFEFNHVFIKDIQDIIKVYESRGMSIMNNKVNRFWTEVVNVDEHQLFLSD